MPRADSWATASPKSISEKPSSTPSSITFVPDGGSSNDGVRHPMIRILLLVDLRHLRRSWRQAEQTVTVNQRPDSGIVVTVTGVTRPLRRSRWTFLPHRGPRVYSSGWIFRWLIDGTGLLGRLGCATEDFSSVCILGIPRVGALGFLGKATAGAGAIHLLVHQCMRFEGDSFGSS